MTEPHLATNRPRPMLVPENARRSAVGPDLQPLLSELHAPDRSSFKVPHAPADALEGVPREHLRSTPLALPEIDEPTVVHHFVRLSHLNYSVDSGIYPLGSCTMKYNPKINEQVARLPGFAGLHPLAPDALAQGSLELMWTLQQQLGEIGGFPAVSLQPAAGAHGELAGILVIRAYHLARGDVERDEVIVPDSSHGTNPATASMAGFRAVTVTSTEDGLVDIEALRRGRDGDRLVAGHRGRGRVRAMGRVGHDDLGALDVATGKVVGADDEDAGELAVGPGGRLQRDRGEATDLGQLLLQ